MTRSPSDPEAPLLELGERWTLESIASALDSAPTVTADFLRIGPSKVRRVLLGRAEELSPSRRFWGPYYLLPFQNDEFPFKFDRADGCGRCEDDIVQRWMTGAEAVAPCTAADPCMSSGHCDLCRDAAWFQRLLAALDRIDAVPQHGEVRHADIYAVRFSYLLRPN